ncbi:MAG: hypothetical protein ABSA39_22995 [Edaphobacter sp.]
MHILFSISALCFFALVAVGVAIARQVRSGRTSTHPQHDFAQHLFDAARDQDSRRPRTVPLQHVKDVTAKNSQTVHLQASTRTTASKPY